MTNTKDLRVVKNKKNINAAFLELLSTKKYEEITVSQICKKALINRSTFYFHYSNKDELLDTMYIDVMTDYSKLMMESFQANKHNLSDCIIKAFKHVTRHSDVINIILKMDETKKLQDTKIKSLFVNQFLLYSQKSNIKFKKTDYAYYYACLFASCAVETLHWWLDCGMKEERYEEVSKIIIGCLENGINKAFFE